MRYFLVDFENVSDSGLKGFFSLKADDQVVLFYTLKANRVSMEFFEAVMTRPHGGSLRFLQVSAGNQALDLQLASYLGSLVAAGEGDCEYYIISKDKGFQCLVSFWEKQGKSLRLRQFSCIAEALSQRWPELPQQQQAPQQQQQPQQQSVPQQPSAPQPEKQPIPQPEKPVPQPEKQPAPQPVEAPPQPVEPAPVPQPEKPAPQQPEPKPEPPKPAPALPVPAPQRALTVQSPEKAQPKQEPQAKAEPQPKPEPQPKQQDPQPKQEAPNGQNKNQNQKNQPNEKTLLNTRVQQALSKAKFETQIISHVASLVAKTFGKPKVRQLVYLDLIKEYGQKKGLEIYQLVKPLL